MWGGCGNPKFPVSSVLGFTIIITNIILIESKAHFSCLPTVALSLFAFSSGRCLSVLAARLSFLRAALHFAVSLQFVLQT